MRIDRITLKGITRFADEVSVDLAELGAGLIAFAGTNGAGKTTLLEAAAAGLHLEYPSRPGPLHQVAHGKDARIELEIQNGQPYRTTVAVDAVLKHPKTEAYLFNGDGSPVTDGKVRNYQEAIAGLVGSPKLMLAAALSAQNRRGAFLELSKSEKKDVISDILDTAGLQALAEAARAKAKESELQIERSRALLEAARDELARLQADHVDVGEPRARRDELVAEVAQLAEDLEAAREEYSSLQRQQAEADAARREVARLLQDVLDTEKRLEANEVARDRAAEAFSTRRRILVGEISDAEAEASKVQEYENAARLLDERRHALAETRKGLDAARSMLDEARSILVAAERQQTEATVKRKVLRSRIETAERATGLLGQVPCTSATGWVAAEVAGTGIGPEQDLAGGCPLLADARSAKDEAEKLKQQLSEIVVVDTMAEAAAVAERENHLERHRRSVNDIEAAIAEVQGPAGRLDAAKSAADRVARCRRDMDAAAEEHRQRIAELNQEQDALTGRIAELENERGQAAASIPEDLKPQMEAAKARGLDVRKRHDEAQTELLGIERQVARAEAAQERVQQLEKTVAETGDVVHAINIDLNDWRVLERALGRDGIQALEIDAAGPELSELTNDLLNSTFGPRFEVRFITQAPRRDGGMKEVFDVTVIDHDRGREGLADTLSGGEKVIVSEAIGLALSIYAGRNSKYRFLTLFRDETSGALDPENAHRYVQMLRKARELSGAFQIVFVAQQPDIWTQADAVVWIENGRVEVR